MNELFTKCTGGKHMKKCPFCGASIADDVYHCPKCKAGIPHEVKKEPEPEKVKKRRSETYGT